MENFKALNVPAKKNGAKVSSANIGDICRPTAQLVIVAINCVVNDAWRHEDIIVLTNRADDVDWALLYGFEDPKNDALEAVLLASMVLQQSPTISVVLCCESVELLGTIMNLVVIWEAEKKCRIRLVDPKSRSDNRVLAQAVATAKRANTVPEPGAIENNMEGEVRRMGADFVDAQVRDTAE
jgi:hypothetical protein